MPCTWAGFCHIDEDKPELLEILASPLMKRAEVVKQLVNTQSDSVLSSPSKSNDEGRWSKTTSVFQTKTRTGIIWPTQTAHSRTFCVQRRTSVGSGFGNSALNRNKDFRMWQHDDSKETDIWILLHFGLRNHLPQKNIMVKAKSNLGWLPGLL